MQFRWLVIILLCLAPLTTQAFSVSGSIIGGSDEIFDLKWVFAVPMTLDTFYAAVAIPILNTYMVSNLDSGSYFFAAYQDVNTSLIPDLGEPYGFYGGTFPVALLVNENLQDIDIELTTPEQGGFSGTITYAGEETGATYIMAYETADFTGTPSGAGFLLNNEGNGTYTAITDTQATFYAIAFMDLNNNIQYDENEPMGVYGGEEPEPFEVELPDMPTDINITMIDVDQATPRPRVGGLPEGFSLGVPYPNPFNAETTIPFMLGRDAQVELVVLDVLGREAGVIDSGRMTAGEHTVKFNAHGYSSGIYFIELVADGSRSMQRVVLVK